jgi:hypothetical protein
MALRVSPTAREIKKTTTKSALKIALTKIDEER